MESLNIFDSQTNSLFPETLDKVVLSDPMIPRNLRASLGTPIVNAEFETIEVTPVATYLGGEGLIFPDQSFLWSQNTQGATAGTDPLIGNAGVNTQVILSEAIATATVQLAHFINQPNSLDGMHLAFGDNWQAEQAIALVQSLATGAALPKIEIIPIARLGANGAFAKETNTIYLAAEFLRENAANLDAIAAVILEETGHFLDSQLNRVDSLGDEGAIFAALVQGKQIAPGELLALKAEDDSGTLTLNGQIIQVEHSSTEPGVFTVGDTGEITIDFLTDSGSYTGEVGIFSLKGMEGLARDSLAFIQEAARRVLSNSNSGYVAISDGTEGGRFSGELGESNRNEGDYRQVKTFAMNPDEEFAIMLVPNGTFGEILNNQSLEGDKRPLFSIAAANPGNAVQMGQLVSKSVDGGTFAFEDIALDGKTDRDYNDLIFELKGATGFAKQLTELIAGDEQWENTELGQKLRNFAAEELSTATDLGTVTSSQSLTGFVGNDDPTDVYRFTLGSASNVNFTLSGLTADADLVVIQDVDDDGVLGEDLHIQEAEIIGLSELEGTASETIDALLQAGTYFIQVEQYEGDTNYNLGLNITPFAPPTDTAPNTIPTARNLGAIGDTLPAISEYVGSADTIDYFKFTVNTQSDLDLELSDLTGDADVRLIRDANNNGVVEDGEEIDFSDAIGDDDEFIFAPDLAAGDYFIEVKQVNGEVSYDLLLNATASTTPPDNAGESLGEARNLGILSGNLPTITDSVNVRDRQDLYKFTLNQTSTFNLSLSGITTDADVFLIRDADNDNEKDAGDIIAASTLKAGDEKITLNLAAGNYTIEVFDALGDTNYDLNLSATPTTESPTPTTPAEGTTLATAIAKNSAAFTESGTVSATTQSKLYKFTVNESGIFTANLTGLTGDADVRLLGDYNNNGLIDPVVDRNGNVYLDKDEVEIVAWQPNRNNSNESIRAFLEKGDYYLEVNSPLKAETNYEVATTFTPAATDPLAFKFNLTFTDAARNALNIKHTDTSQPSLKEQTLLQTVQAAADYWSRVISYSSFQDAPHTIDVKVDAKDMPRVNGSLTLAFAGARQINRDAKGLYMPVTGASTINTNSATGYPSDVRYLYETMIHEFGHVIGLRGDSPKRIQDNGGQPSPLSWNNRDLIDLSRPNNPLYKANTFAGIAYGQLLGKNEPTALTVTPGQGVNDGSAYAHWYTKVFDLEAMVESGSSGNPERFSTISVASARDLGYNVNYGGAEPYTPPKQQA